MSDKFNARKGLEIGRGLAEDATIEVKNSSANFPYVKYSETEQVWKFSNDGTTESEFGSGGSWGEITGTLSDQTDLQTELDDKLNSADNLIDVADQQTALNNITAVSSATDEYVLTKDTVTGNATWKEIVSSDELTKVSANDTTTGYLEDKIVVSSGTNATSVLETSTLNDGENEELQIQLDETKIAHDNLSSVNNVGSGVSKGHISDTAETIYGVKTFDSFPVTPSSEPTTDYQVVNKKYVDDNTIPDSVADGNIYARRDNTWEQVANLIGPAPQHTWDGTKISFENPDGTYDEEKELMPSHEWNLSPTTKKIKFQNPEGGYGDEIDLSSYNYFFTEDKIGEVKEWIWTNCPENFLKLDGSTLHKSDNEEFFEFLIAEGEILDTDTEYTLPTQANKIIRVKTNLNAIYKIVDSVPVGVVNALATETIPEGWLECNGAELSRTTYSELFATIGTTYGAGNGSTTFKLPDLRGEFIRGFDGGRGIDSGRVLGSWQGDAIRNITGQFRIAPTHAIPTEGTGAFTTLTSGITYLTTGYSGTRNYGIKLDVSRVVPTADENRPRNIALKYIIKYKLGDGRLS